jgi:carbonic anhydrase/acetyltransferase-like protein (isoleucine patch superfamily)
MKDVTLLPWLGMLPDIAPSAFVAPGARLIGPVSIGAESSIWYNCVLRGDANPITIGARSNIQDGSVIHSNTGQTPTTIGDDCLVGHMVTLHGCILEDRAFVGMGSLVMDDVVIEEGGMLAAGSMLTPGKRIGRGQMWMGRPARYLRDLTPEELAGNMLGIRHYVETARAHAAIIAAGGADQDAGSLSARASTAAR